MELLIIMTKQAPYKFGLTVMHSSAIVPVRGCSFNNKPVGGGQQKAIRLLYKTFLMANSTEIFRRSLYCSMVAFVH